MGTKTDAAKTSAVTTDISAPLLKLKLLDSLRGGDPERIRAVMDEISRAPSPASAQLRSAVLVLAVEVGSLATVQFVATSGLADDINYQDPAQHGATALHAAAQAARNDVVALLMALPGINDCVVNDAGQQPVECAASMDTVQLLSDLRTRYVEQQAARLRTAFEARKFDDLKAILAQPRARELLDINGTDPVTGETVLLEFVRRDDVAMVRFILGHGGDPFKRSISGKLPLDAARSPGMRRLLRDACNRQSVIDYPGAAPAGGSEEASAESAAPNSASPASAAPGAAGATSAGVSTSAPTFKGFLKKWTNFAGGYKLRWFVLTADGTLAYYRSPNDVESSCRGAVHLAHARVRMDSSEKCRFEIVVAQPDGSAVRWHLRANHQVESSRWVWTLQNAIQYARDRERRGKRKEERKEERAKSLEERRSAEFVSAGSPGSTTNPSAPPTASASTDVSASVSATSAAHAHQRSASRTSVASVSSHGSVASRAKKLYQKPMHGLGRLTQKSVDALSRHTRGSSRQLPPGGPTPVSASSFVSSSAAISSDSETDDEASVSGDEATVDKDVDLLLADLVARKRRPEDRELDLVRNQLRVELQSFREYLSAAASASAPSASAASSAPSAPSVVNVAQQIIGALQQLFDHEGEILSRKRETLERLFDRQREISGIWESSVRQLELEIQEREGTIADLQATIRKVRRSLRASVVPGEGLSRAITRLSMAREGESETGENKATGEAQQEKFVDSNPEAQEALPEKLQEKLPEPGESADASRRMSVASTIEADDELTRFMEESGSEDEFFDAEEEEEEEAAAKRAEEEIIGEGETGETTSEATAETAEAADEAADEATQAKVAQAKPAQAKPAQGGIAQASAAQAKTAHANTANAANAANVATGSAAPGEAGKVTFHGDAFVAPKVDGQYIVNGAPLRNDTQIARYERMLREHTFDGYEDPLRWSLKKEDDRPKISLWGVLKSLIGKDMTRMTLPVAFNEPTSLLQRNIEIMEYSDLLDEAAKCAESTRRLAYVAGFAASEYVSTVGRIAKPFNPLLGETYEYSRPDKGYRVLCEQVSHHPPISAVLAQSPRWAYYGESNVNTKFWGRSFDIKHLGTWFCELYPDGAVSNRRTGKQQPSETYSWKKVNNSVVGIIIGRPTIDNYGEMRITNHATGDYMDFHFKARGWRASSAFEVKGEVYAADGTLAYQVAGHWNTTIYARRAGDPAAQRFVIFQAHKRHEMLFHLTNFAATLNAPAPHLLPRLACTDTRLRPDQRAMENGQYDFAADEKDRLEKKQRVHRKELEDSGKPYRQAFFTRAKHPVTNDDYWQFNDRYWVDREKGELKSYRDIF